MFLGLRGSIISRSTPMFDADTGLNVGGASESSSTPVDNVSQSSESIKPASLSEYLDRKAEESVKVDTTGQVTEVATESEVVKDEPLILGKFKSQDDVVKSYVNLESLSTKNAQQLSQIRAENERLAQELESIKASKQETPPIQEELTPEKLEQMKDAELELMMSDPVGYKKKLLEDIKSELKKDIAPAQTWIQKEESQRKWNEATATFAETNPDFKELTAEIVEVFNEFPTLYQKSPDAALQKAYELAKNSKLAKEASSNKVNPEELAKDPEFLKKYVYSNPEVTNTVLKSHLKNISDGAPPPTINSSTGGSPAVTPKQKAGSLGEASRRFLEKLGL